MPKDVYHTLKFITIPYSAVLPKCCIQVSTRSYLVHVYTHHRVLFKLMRLYISTAREVGLIIQTGKK